MTEIHTPTPIRSYSGKIGCMCGCLGEYSDDPVVMAAALKRMLKNPDTKYDANAKCFYYLTKTRNNVVYIKH